MERELLFTGLSSILPFDTHDISLLLLRLTIGVFFFSYRFRWVYDPAQPVGDRWLSSQRHKRLIQRLCTCGFSSCPALADVVAVVEILSGLGLIAGLLAVPSALGIVCVMAFANFCTPKEEIPIMHPVDRIDYIPCYLKMCEPLYLVMALVILVTGPGKWSFDYLLFG